MSIADDFLEYKDLLVKNPSSITYDLVDALGNTYRYHRQGAYIFAAVMNRRGQFTALLKDLRLH